MDQFPQPYCILHPNIKSEYVRINNESSLFEYACRKCFQQKKGFNFLSLDDLFQQIDENQTIMNWPNLKNKELFERFEKIYEQFNNNKKISNLSESVSKSINKIIGEFNQKIKSIEKQILSHISDIKTEVLFEVYSKISQKELRSKKIKNEDDLEETLKKLIINNDNNVQEYERIIEEQCSKFENIVNILEEVNFKKNIDEIYGCIDEINNNIKQKFTLVTQKPQQKPTQTQKIVNIKNQPQNNYNQAEQIQKKINQTPSQFSQSQFQWRQPPQFKQDDYGLNKNDVYKNKPSTASIQSQYSQPNKSQENQILSQIVVVGNSNPFSQITHNTKDVQKINSNQIPFKAITDGIRSPNKIPFDHFTQRFERFTQRNQQNRGFLPSLVRQKQN